MRPSHPILLLQLGEAPDAITAVHGGYASWVERAIEGTVQVHDIRRGTQLPDARAFAGIVISGSRTSLTKPEPWVDAAVDLVRRAHEAGTPTLGICFGHQLIAHAFGAAVVRNPAGPELGTLPVELTEAGRRDPLFAGGDGASTFRANLSHEDAVDPGSLPGTPVVVLARSAMTPVTALAVGEHLRGVQFHPEFSGPVCRAYLERHRDDMGAARIDPLLAIVADVPRAMAVLRNFRRFYVERERPGC